MAITSKQWRFERTGQTVLVFHNDIKVGLIVRHGTARWRVVLPGAPGKTARNLFHAKVIAERLYTRGLAR